MFHHLTKTTLSPDSLRAADLQLEISSNNHIIKNRTSGTFHEKSSLVSHHSAVKQWTLNDTGDAITLNLFKGDVYVCEVLIHVYPG
jgi:hypothetical protein